MSSGAFVKASYKADNGNVHRIRVQPETLDLTIDSIANDPTLDQVNAPGFVRVSGSRRSYGLHSRTVTIKMLSGDQPVGYVDGSTLTLPWLDGSTFTSLTPGQVGQYLGATVELISKRAEVFK